MAQMTIRTSDEVVRRTKEAAARSGRSMNDWVAAVLDAATNPDLADSESERVRERLLRAGLLVVPTRMSGQRPSAAAVNEAGRRAAKGRALSEHVSDGR